jgi:hypothetical protein
VRRCDRVFWKEVNGRADFGCFLPHCCEVVTGESALAKQETNSFFNRAALQHVGVQPPQNGFC